MQFAEDEVEFLFRPSGQSIDAQPTIRPPGEAGRKMFPSRLGPAPPTRHRRAQSARAGSATRAARHPGVRNRSGGNVRPARPRLGSSRRRS